MTGCSTHNLCGAALEKVPSHCCLNETSRIPSRALVAPISRMIAPGVVIGILGERCVIHPTSMRIQIPS
ncbi:hypothetical protein Plim_4128 [Planctopirus limnophila DSM 3776]|uniref:Uncharacterized protein n=1 Tax=Planctopirus limnophila (strain ATCC 43296 / DSM 3776 / IFAM 1008 / Mu 290) TaxID=521674 RepID=D5SZ38_PLAL2|nr:hypothetical protein Plim_4128 [Planctopirus limnophila DSM 3776]